MEGRARRIDELPHFFLAQNRGRAVSLFRMGSASNAPLLFERLDVEKTQRPEIGGHRTRRQLPFCEEMCLVLRTPECAAGPSDPEDDGNVERKLRPCEGNSVW